jgi:carbonic anhydrase
VTQSGPEDARREFPERLLEGYRAFVGERLPRERSRFAALAETGQRPQVMIVSCCDSRVSPEVIFDVGPGELFVVRNVAALVPPYAPDGDYHGTSAALEFGVQALLVKHIVVLGHARCGGIRAFADDAAPLSAGDFIGKWMTIVAPAAARLGKPRLDDDYLGELERAAIEQSLVNLMTFPYVEERVRAGSLTLHGAYFGVATGLLLVRDPNTGSFAPVSGGPQDKV